MRIYRIKKNKEDVDDCFNCENLFIIDAFKIRWKPATIFFPEENILDWFWNYFQDGGLHGQHAEIMFERLWLNFPGIRDQNEKKTGIFFDLYVDMRNDYV